MVRGDYMSAVRTTGLPMLRSNHMLFGFKQYGRLDSSVIETLILFLE